MISKIRVRRALLAVAMLAAVDGVCATFDAHLTQPAQAQLFGGDRYQPRRRSGGFLQDLFGPYTQPRYEGDSPGSQSGPSESARAPAARKPDKDALPPTTSIVVMGDGMADWLAYGLEEAFGDAPEIGIVRKNKLFSGLLHYEARSDLDWWHVAKDLLAPEKPNYVIMMLGVGDRQNISQRDLAKEAEKKAKDEKAKDDAKSDAKPDAAQDAQKKEAGDEGETIAAPEPRGKRPSGVVEFRSDQWAQIYSRRIDDTIAALKSKGVPVFWVGLPSIRGTKSTSDVVYLNDLYRTRAERAGVVYIDVWDGFVDEGGKFTTFGPDYEGQNRRLRAGDGVYFTKYGARKLAHYVEREIRRYMTNRGPIALPSGPMGPVPSDGKPAVRPLAGPIVPLTVTPGNSDVLLGSGPGAPAHGDAIAAQVLVKGEPVPAPRGRADDFVWPGAEQPVQPAPAAPPVAAPKPTPQANVAPAQIMQPEAAKPEPRSVKPGETTAARPKPAQDTRPRPPQPVQQQAPRQQRPSPFDRGGPFGWLR